MLYSKGLKPYYKSTKNVNSPFHQQIDTPIKFY
jgi:hypothetical protein